MPKPQGIWWNTKSELLFNFAHEPHCCGFTKSGAKFQGVLMWQGQRPGYLLEPRGAGPRLSQFRPLLLRRLCQQVPEEPGCHLWATCLNHTSARTNLCAILRYHRATRGRPHHLPGRTRHSQNQVKPNSFKEEKPLGCISNSQSPT